MDSNPNNAFSAETLPPLLAQQANVGDILQRFRAIQERLLLGYEQAAAEALVMAHDADPLVAQFYALRHAWNTQAAEELRGRMP